MYELFLNYMIVYLTIALLMMCHELNIAAMHTKLRVMLGHDMFKQRCSLDLCYTASKNAENRAPILLMRIGMAALWPISILIVISSSIFNYYLGDKTEVVPCLVAECMYMYVFNKSDVQVEVINYLMEGKRNPDNRIIENEKLILLAYKLDGVYRCCSDSTGLPRLDGYRFRSEFRVFLSEQ